MSKHLQIRDVPEETHRALKARAAAEGLSMSAYLKRLIDQDLKRPNWDTMVERMRKMTTLDLGVSTAELIREDRESR